MNVRIKIISRQLVVSAEPYKLRLVMASPLPRDLQSTSQRSWGEAKQSEASCGPSVPPSSSSPPFAMRQARGGRLALLCCAQHGSHLAAAGAAVVRPEPRPHGAALEWGRHSAGSCCSHGDKRQEGGRRAEEGALRSEGQRGRRRGGLEGSGKTTGAAARRGEVPSGQPPGPPCRRGCAGLAPATLGVNGGAR